MEKTTKTITKLSRFLDLIGGYCYFAMMILAVANIIGRRVIQRPILGTIELVEVLAALGVGLTIAYCALQDEHITVDFIFDYFPKKLKGVITVIVNVLLLVFLGLCSYMIFQYGYSIQLAGRVTTTLGIPYYPFLYVIAFGFLMYLFVALVKIINVYRKKEV